MLNHSHLSRLLLVTAVVAASAAAVHADTFYLKDGFGTSNWGITSDWTANPDGTGANPDTMAGNDFNNNGNTLGTPSGDQTFQGDSLTLDGGALNLRNGGTKTVASLTATNGTTIYSGSNGTSISVASFNNASGTTQLRAEVGSVGDQAIFFSFAALTGSGDIEVAAASSGSGRIVDLNVGNGSAFTGDIGWLDGNLATLHFANDATFGGSLTAGATSRITLDHNVTFAAATINGDSLAAGTYSFAALDAAYGEIFNDGGTGSITVVGVPEPASLMLLGVAGLVCVARRRKV